MERPHGDAGPHRIHHHKAMGDNVMSYAGWYKTRVDTQNILQFSAKSHEAEVLLWGQP
jgi:hypothetical protein